MKSRLFSKSGIYTNKKTGKQYRVLSTVINCTNSQDGQEMVLYVKDGKMFVREINEFFEKFEETSQTENGVEITKEYAEKQIKEYKEFLDNEYSLIS